jgi:hypothetical protein
VLAIILFRVLSRRRFLSAADGDVAFAVLTMHDHGGQVQFFFFEIMGWFNSKRFGFERDRRIYFFFRNGK